MYRINMYIRIAITFRIRIATRQGWNFEVGTSCEYEQIQRIAERYVFV